MKPTYRRIPILVVLALLAVAILPPMLTLGVDRDEAAQNAAIDRLNCTNYGEDCPTSTPEPTATATSEPTATHTPTPEPTATAAPQTCQQLHDSYTATGPDGVEYPTWHPMKVGDCIFGHDHGNDPESVAVGFQPLYGYVNATHGMIESHHGFKTYAFRDQLRGVDWVITQHQGTTTRNALCGRFHALNFVAFQNGEMKANLSVMGDFGQSRLGEAMIVMTPPECPQNAQIVSQGFRRIPTGDDGYTPYIVNGKFPELGLRIRISFLTTDGRTACPDKVCAALNINEGNTGSRRRFQTLAPESVSINQALVTTNSGWFTDSMGVRQYIAPGFNTRIDVATSNRATNGANAMWYFNGEWGPMESAFDRNAYNGVAPILPLSWFKDAN